MPTKYCKKCGTWIKIGKPSFDNRDVCGGCGPKQIPDEVVNKILAQAGYEVKIKGYGKEKNDVQP